MKLTSYTNYALRSLQLAALKSPDLVRVDDVARIHNLSRPHIMKIVHELESLGLVERREDPTDSRAKLIDFTVGGRELIAELSQSTETVWQQYAEIVGSGALEQTVNNLNTLLQAGEQTRE